MPRVITVDKNASYPIAIDELKKEKKLSKDSWPIVQKNGNGKLKLRIYIGFTLKLMHRCKNKNRNICQ